MMDAFCNEVLTVIEVGETRVLNWGFIEAQTSLERELPRLLDELRPDVQERWQQAREAGVTPPEVIQNLLERRLLFRPSPGLYRSRYAETVRLLALLRQRFTWKDWNTAPPW